MTGKRIDTLVADINDRVLKSAEPKDMLRMLTDFAHSYSRQVNRKTGSARRENTLFFSEVGEDCPRKLWWRFNGTALKDDLPPEARIKFIYGDLLEALVLQLCRDAGHTVEKQQESVEIDLGGGWQVRGRIDAVIDGVTVDVKSVTRNSVDKFRAGLAEDPFGYRGQLTGYQIAMGTERAGFLTIQKELGHVEYFDFTADEVDQQGWLSTAHNAVDIVSAPDPMAMPRMLPVVHSKGSNKTLGTKCSYCEFKSACWADANGGKGIRYFKYSNRVVPLVEVHSTPNVEEIHGKK